MLQAGEPTARRAWTGSNARWLGNYLAKLGEARLGQGVFPEAEDTLLEAHGLLSAGFGPDHQRTLKCVKRLTALYDAWDAAEPGKGDADKAAQRRAKLPPSEPSSAEFSPEAETLDNSDD